MPARSGSGRPVAGCNVARRSDLLVLRLPRGGVPVASESARALHAPPDILIGGKAGVPGQPELTMGAITSGGSRVFNDNAVHHLTLSRQNRARIVNREERELTACRERLYRQAQPAPAIAGLVDDRTWGYHACKPAAPARQQESVALVTRAADAT